MFSLRHPTGNAVISLLGSNVGINVTNPQASLDVGAVLQAGTQLTFGAATTGGSAAGLTGNPASDRIVLQKGSGTGLPYALGVGSASLYASVPAGAAVNLQVAGANVLQVASAGASVAGTLGVTGQTTLANISAAAAGVSTLTATGLGTFGSVAISGPASFGNGITQTAGGAVNLTGAVSMTGGATTNSITTNTATVTGTLTSNGLLVPGSAVINLGSDQTKEVSAGFIGYQRFDQYLDIVGAGTQAGSRGVCIFDNLYVSSGVQVNGAMSVFQNAAFNATSTFNGTATFSVPLSVPNANSFSGRYSELSNVPFDQVFTGVANAAPTLTTNVTTYLATGTTAGTTGQATFYPTATGKLGGAPLFTTILSVQASAVANVTTGSTVITAGVKFANTTLIVINAASPGTTSGVLAPANTPIYLQVKGT